MTFANYPKKGPGRHTRADRVLTPFVVRCNTGNMPTVTLTPEADKQLERLPAGIVARVLELLERLKNWPNVSGAKPLRGELTGRYRLRTGDYRVQFFVRGETVVVEKIGNRDRFYGD